MHGRRRVHPRASVIPLVAAAALALAGCAGVPGQASRATAGGPSGDGYRGGETVVVLLPESGRFAGAGQAVRDGILAAQGADEQGRRPRLVFRDTGEGGDASDLVRAAVAAGASYVIGPIQKEPVERLAAGPALPVPVLALNRAPGVSPPAPNLFQFALAPEDEAAAAAEKAWQAGRRSALMLYPGSAWGERVAGGFRERWAALGGGVISGAVYDPNAYDLSGAVGTLIGPTEAQGADVLFLVATTERARQLLPLIRARTGDRLAVFATSHASGPSASGPDGLYYVDIPWLVGGSSADPLSFASLRARLPDFRVEYAQLYAMGIDAYRLAPRLQGLARRPGTSLEGKTGILTLDSQRNVRRGLTLARIEAGAPVAVAAAGSAGASQGPSAPGRRAVPLLAAHASDTALGR